MKFCPMCQTRLTNGIAGLVCLKCQYLEGAQRRPESSSAKIDPVFNVLEESERDDMLPTIKIDCKKCGHGEAVWWMLQTRSADEPTTQFYRCVKCRYTWRDYS